MFPTLQPDGLLAKDLHNVAERFGYYKMPIILTGNFNFNRRDRAN
jgi:hypothetical protein